MLRVGVDACAPGPLNSHLVARNRAATTSGAAPTFNDLLLLVPIAKSVSSESTHSSDGGNTSKLTSSRLATTSAPVLSVLAPGPVVFVLAARPRPRTANPASGPAERFSTDSAESGRTDHVTPAMAGFLSLTLLVVTKDLCGSNPGNGTLCEMTAMVR